MNVKGIHIVIIILSIVVVASCSPKVRYSVLTTIFDGVPPQKDKTLTIGKDTLQIDTTRFLAVARALSGPSADYHTPYQKKDCGSCHDQLHMGQLVAKEPQLCYQCHDADNEKHSYKHGPAGAGFCTSCHSPHLAEADNLLITEGDDLCFNCHSSESVAENIIHEKVGDKSCVECHNPHSSENRFMLQSGACFSCHENKTEDYTFLHGPVSGDYCATCHESHSSKNKNLLELTGQGLCLKCHDSNTLSMNQEHMENKNESCMDCHNPHGGETEFMLN